MLQNYLINQVEGAAELCHSALHVVRSLKERREGVSKGSHVAIDQKSLVAELTEHLLRKSQENIAKWIALTAGVWYAALLEWFRFLESCVHAR